MASTGLEKKKRQRKVNLKSVYSRNPAAEQATTELDADSERAHQVLTSMYGHFATLNHGLRYLKDHVNGPVFLERSLTCAKYRRQHSVPFEQKRTSCLPQIPCFTYASLELKSLLIHGLNNLRSRSGQSLLKKALPIEILVYYSGIARGCAEDQ